MAGSWAAAALLLAEEVSEQDGLFESVELTNVSRVDVLSNGAADLLKVSHVSTRSGGRFTPVGD